MAEQQNQVEEPFKCCGCGKPAPDRIKPCGCVTMCGFRNGESCVFKEAAKQKPVVDEEELRRMLWDMPEMSMGYITKEGFSGLCRSVVAKLRPYLTAHHATTTPEGGGQG